MEWKKIFIFLTLAALILISGCADIKSPEIQNKSGENLKTEKFPITVTDDFGFNVTVDKKPERIISLAPSNTEILFALGLGDRIVGVTEYCNYPEEAKERPKVGGYSTIDIEKVLSLKPDLVVASFGNGEETIQTLKEYNLTVIALNPKDLKGIIRDIEMLGKVTGEEENATRLIKMMENKIETVKAKAEKMEARPKVAHILWHDPIYVSGNGTFVNELITIAGGQNAFGDVEGWKVVSIEDLYSKDPDIIIVNSGDGMNANGENIIYEWVTSELKDLRAVKEGKVFVINSDMISRPSYRLVYALEEISNIIAENSG
ncbi:ABC transporter substrate-binding protein [Geoglobus acetivorans]|uniref:Vitamin B12 ABC transporter, B12-binding component BtuF n=1 Tax=Geoglobus acetivorans TaxID=565033 RepID=A0A0A7GFP4_GEOAI|nr:Vitamin B12 ABC transporter, B12-binding component BtuF [Geoglobus acetivorans]